MANVVWAPGISTVSGALSKINKKSPHAADQQMLLATHRTAPTTSGECNKLFLRGIKSVTRSTPVTASELEVRERFSAVSRAVAARRVDLSKITADVAAFKAQKDQPGGKKTMTSYLWMVELNKYDQEHNG